MSFNKSVVIFGKTLNLAGISACLKHEEDLVVFEIDPQDPDARQQLEAMTPDVIFFDLSDPSSDLDMVLLRSKPGLLLIGVNPSKDEVIFLKGHSSRVFTTGDLSKLISNHTTPEIKNRL
jgi:hypothetical protein